MRKLFWILIGAFTLLSPLAVQAMCPPCGHRPRQIKIRNPQRVYVFHRAGVQDLILEASYEGKASDFGMILPIPSVPDVRMVKHSFFDSLTKVAGNFPRFTRPALTKRLRAESAGKDWQRNIRVVRQQVTALFNAVTLKAKTTRALQKWLDLHNYKYESGNYAMEVFQDYIDRKWLFLAVKVRVDKAPRRFKGRFRPMGVKFKSKKIVVPTRVASIRRNGMPFEFYVVTNRPVKFPKSWNPRRKIALPLSPNRIVKEKALMREMEKEAFFGTTEELENLAKKMKSEDPDRYQKLLQRRLRGLHLSVFTGHFSRAQLKKKDLILEGDRLLTPSEVRNHLQTLKEGQSLKKIRQSRRILEAVGSEHVPLLIKALKGSKNNQFRITIAGILGSLGEPAAVPALLEVLASEKDRLVRWALRDALRDITGITSDASSLKPWKKWWKRWSDSSQ